MNLYRLLPVSFKLGMPVFVLAITAVSNAGSCNGGEPTPQSSEKNPVEEKTVEPLCSGDLGVNFVSAYFAFGILQENKGMIAEPYFDISRTLFAGEGFVNKVTFGLQLWSSMHSKETDAGKSSAVPWWYEFDYYIPVAVTINKKWTLTVSYLDYEFPGAAFSPQRGVQGNIAYDDSEILGPFALHPHALILYNFEGVLGIGRSKAWYGEVGIAPTASIAGKSRYPVTLSFPLLAGFGDNHFFPGSIYGYFSASANATVPLAFLPKSFGPWTANAGLTYYNLGQATAGINANHDHSAYVWQLGLGATF